MTDTAPLPPDMAALTQDYEAWATRTDQLVLANKAALFSHLAPLGITLVTVTFDGEGDSGQIEDVQARRGDEAMPLPEQKIDVLHLGYDDDAPVARSMTLAEAIEEVCYDLLGQKHDGWENSDGAYGEFVLDIAAGTISLDFNERFTSSENHSYSW